MGSKRIINTELAIKEAKEIHGDKYDYQLLKYINYKTPLKIICKEHGIFEQKYKNHCKLGRGCWECGKKSCVDKNFKKYNNIFIDRCKEKHNNFYSYEKTEYVRNDLKVIITCPIHGDFEQQANSHLQGNGCSTCGKEKSSEGRKVGKDYILNIFNKKHGDFYKYSLGGKEKTTDYIDIICPIHGKFKQQIVKHYTYGCNQCGDARSSLKRTKIPKELKKIHNSIKRRIREVIYKNNFEKTKSSSLIIGCSWVDLKIYLEDNDYGFKVSDSSLDLDHIIPISSAKSIDDVYKLNHYSNFQLLPRDYNQHIKRDKPFNKEHFEDWLKLKLEEDDND